MQNLFPSYKFTKLDCIFQSPVCSPNHYFTVCQKCIFYFKLHFASSDIILQYINVPKCLLYFKLQFAPLGIILQYTKHLFYILNSSLLTQTLFYSIPQGRPRLHDSANPINSCTISFQNTSFILMKNALRVQCISTIFDLFYYLFYGDAFSIR